MSETNIELSLPFKERIFERLRNDMGELLTDAELSEIVKKALHEALFKPPPRDGYYNAPEKEPEIYALVRKALAQQIDDAIAAYIKEHPDEIATIVNDCIGKGFSKIVTDYFDSKLFTSMVSVRNEFQNMMQR